jgi:hypothetical protein
MLLTEIARQEPLQKFQPSGLLEPDLQGNIELAGKRKRRTSFRETAGCG